VIETRTRRDSPVTPLVPARPPAAGGGRRTRRAGARLWTLLHAQALLRGSPGGPGDAAFIEDDSRRLAGDRAR
jgi:hypothetical protein